MRVGKLEAGQRAGNLGCQCALRRTDSRLVSRGFVGDRLGVEKKSLRRLRAVAEKLKALPHLDEAERLLYARGLISTPDERWMFSYRYVQLVNSSRPYTKRRFVS